MFMSMWIPKASIREDIGEGDGIYLLPKKDSIDVQWGQFSQVQATLNLLNAAISGGGTAIIS